jgi:TolA-binding protein
VLPAGAERQTVRGRLVHAEVYGLARDLEARGRLREAVRAYQSFLSMYPGHRLGDNALLNVARILRRGDLFAEAAAAYDRLIADYPKGDVTSHAYLEAAYCWECLGDWKRAEELYDMYLKKFPRYRRAGEARTKREAVRKVIKYADLLSEGGLPAAKSADAMYEMGRLLYKKMNNRQKASEVFVRVAESYPKTYHGPDARFTAGVCMLHEQNFESAREQFAALVRDYPQSRLADDAQFWIGHTLEYQARALGRLDGGLIVLRRRSAAEADRLRGDLELRRLFSPPAAAPAAGWHRPHPDLFKSGRVRERVLGGLKQAVAAYRLVVDRHRLGDMAQKALLRTGVIYSSYLNDPDRAVEVYRELLEKYPGSPEAVDAQYAVGEHYLENGELAKAEKAVTQFLTSFPNHSRAADALLLLAECHRRQRKWVKALDDYQSYLARYPASSRAAQIREEVAWLKKYRF